MVYANKQPSLNKLGKKKEKVQTAQNCKKSTPKGRCAIYKFEEKNNGFWCGVNKMQTKTGKQINVKREKQNKKNIFFAVLPFTGIRKDMHTHTCAAQNIIDILYFTQFI